MFKLIKVVKHKLIVCKINANNNIILLTVFCYRKKQFQLSINTYKAKLLNKENIVKVKALQTCVGDYKKQTTKKNNFKLYSSHY